MPVNPPQPRAKPKPSAAVAQAARSAVTEARYQAVNGLFQLGSLGLTARGMYADAAATGIHGPNVSRELASLAESDERIASIIDYLTTAGPYTGLIMAVLPFALQIAANHGRIDASKTMMPGIREPAELEKEMRAMIEEDKRKRSMSDLADGVS